MRNAFPYNALWKAIREDTSNRIDTAQLRPQEIEPGQNFQHCFESGVSPCIRNCKLGRLEDSKRVVPCAGLSKGVGSKRYGKHDWI